MAGPDNMALDVALMARARRTGESVLRVYTWSQPTISLGRNQRAAGEYDLDAIARLGLGVVRRPTGGRALVHHREITYSVTAPAHGSLAGAYHQVNLLLINALGTLGVPATLARPSGPAPKPGSAPCFAEPSAGELVVGGRKLVGSAQWRDDGAMLQHGSILVDDDQPLLAAVTKAPAPPGPRPATLRETIGRIPSAGEVGALLLEAIRETGAHASTLALEQAVLTDADRLAADYADPAWTWRR